MVNFLKSPSKASLLAMLKKADSITPKFMRSLLDGVAFKSDLVASEASVSTQSTSSSFGGAPYVKRDGSTELTADWDAGSRKITAQTLAADVATGTAPLTIASTTKVSNLNADLLDGAEGSVFFHNNVAGEINAVGTSAVGLVGNDLFLVEASGSSYAKRKLTWTVLQTEMVADAGLLKADGSLPLTANWDVGAYDIRAADLTADDGGVYTDDISELTGAAGVTIDSVVLKDGGVTAAASTFGDGGTTNYTEFEADGTIKFNGTATVFGDVHVPVTALRVGPSGAPDFTQFRDDGSGSTGVFLYWFDPSTEQQVYFTIQMPHSWKEGSNISPQVHWVSADTAAGAGTDVSWGLEYTWANINAVFGTTTLIYADEQTNGSGETLTVNKHYETEFADITASGQTIRSMLVGRLFRDAGGNGGTDDYDDDAGLIEVDFHYEMDTIGSRTASTK